MKRAPAFTVVIPVFNVADTSTWPAVLRPEHIAAIYGRAVGGVKKSCQEHDFIPAPYKTKPWRWRRADVLRDVEGGRSVPLRRVG